MKNTEWAQSLEANLRNCPFCGCPAQTRYFGLGNDWFMVECGNRFGACVSMQTVKGAEEILVKKWNSRATSKPCANATPRDCANCCDCIE